MNILVVEDEPLASRLVVQLLARVAPDAAVVGELTSVAGLTRWLAAHPAPDLILADIELEDGRVFDALASTAPVAPIIFLTAYDRFLVDAFRSHGIAYLMKPLREDELAAALAKYEDLRRVFATANPLAHLPRPADDTPPYRRHFTVSHANKIRLIAHDQVAMLRLGLAGIDVIDIAGIARTLTGTASLADIEASLPADHYFRINRTEIIRLDAIVQLDPRKGRILVSLRGAPSPLAVSVHRTAAFRRWVGLA